MAAGIEPTPDGAPDERSAFVGAVTGATPRVVVTPILIVVNVIAFALVAIDGRPTLQATSDVLLRWGALYGPAITHGEWWRLAAAMFLHASLLHLLFNMVVLFQIGGLTERLFGHMAFAIVYGLSGLGGSLASVASHPLNVAVGASGAIFGLYGALFGFLLRQRASIPRDVLRSLGVGAAVVLVANIIYGFFAANVDMVAHFGGLLAGAVAGGALAQPPGPRRAVAAVRRNAAVAAAGLLLAVAAAAWIPAVDDLPAALGRLAMFDRDSARLFDSAVEKLASGEEDQAQFTAAIEEKLLAPWRAHRHGIATLRVPDSERDRVQRVLQYMDRRAEAWRLAAQAVQQGDLALLEKSTAMHRDANQILDVLLAPLARRSADRPRQETPVESDNGAKALQEAFGNVRQLDIASLRLYNDWVGELRAGRLAADVFASRIEVQVVAPWQQQLDRLLRVQVRGTVYVPKMKVVEYMKLRLEGWQLLVKGLRTASPQLVKESTGKHAQAEAVLKGLAGSKP